MEDLLQNILDELKNIKNNQKNDYELLTTYDIANEFNIPINKVRDLFKNEKDLQVQTYTKSHTVTRKNWNEFISVRR